VNGNNNRNSDPQIAQMPQIAPPTPQHQFIITTTFAGEQQQEHLYRTRRRTKTPAI